VLVPFGPNARISQLDIDFDRDPIFIRAAVLTPAIVPDADQRALAAAARSTSASLDLHVDQIRVGLESGAGEAAQVAAARPGDRLEAVRNDRGVGVDAVRVAGVDEESLSVDSTARRITGRFAPLPGAGLDTYRAMEARIAPPGWSAAIVPPPVTPPAVAFTDGSFDTAALDTAAWGARRLGYGISISGSTAQVEVLTAALAERGVAAVRGPGSGPVGGAGLAWTVAPAPAP